MEDHPRKNLVLAAMIFAVAMMFIDMTIVSIAAPELQKDLELSSTGLQWVVNGYLLSLSALFALGGRLADVMGHRTMVILGVVVFALSSAACGFTPEGSLAEPWIIVFRVLEGAGAALMFPAALAIVIAAFPVRERGKAMGIFFGIAGGLTAVGPIAGGYLSEWTWRAIFWVNIPVAIIALVLTAVSKPPQNKQPAPIDYRGALLVTAGMGLAILGLQQASTWDWGSPATIGSIVAGLALLAAFVRYELRVENPLINMSIFRDRGFASENAVLFIMMICFIPLFFFASLYAQVGLEQGASEAGLYLLIFFGGFAVATQIGGRILDKRGAKPAVVPGAIIAAVGFYLWAGTLPDLNEGDQWHWIVMVGVGMGLMLSPANTDAINRAPATAYGEATGITQTVRNFGSSLGMAVLGTILINTQRTNIESSLAGFGIKKEEADSIADSMSESSGGDTNNFADESKQEQAEIFDAIQLDFANAMETVFYVMAAVMAVSFVVALITMPRGLAPAPEEQGGLPADAGPRP
jgi:EmrB/QacA subfamily drug resistance transporter